MSLQPRKRTPRRKRTTPEQEGHAAQLPHAEPHSTTPHLAGRNGTAEIIPSPAVAAPAECDPVQGIGRLASSVAEGAITWFVEGLIPHRTLSFVVGQPQTGKSTCGAWLCGQAQRSAILPGQEEEVEVALIPRLRAARVILENCLILDSRTWVFPADRIALTTQLRRFRPEILWIDPLDSYVSLPSENDGDAVRAALESLCRLARDVPCAVVCVRHPGKNPNNLCPGSRQWRAVPRMIVELRRDIGPPERRFLRTDRDPAGRGQTVHNYTLEGAEGEAKRFVLGVRIGGSDLELTDLSDPIERRMIDEAMELLKGLLAIGEQDSAMIYSMAEKERLKERTVRYAARRIGVVCRREGSGKDHRCLWSWVDPGTPAVTHTHPPNDGVTPS